MLHLYFKKHVITKAVLIEIYMCTVLFFTCSLCIHYFVETHMLQHYNLIILIGLEAPQSGGNMAVNPIKFLIHARHHTKA